MATIGYPERRAAIRLLRSGQTVKEIAAELQCSPAWVYKWRDRFRADGWAQLKDRSRAPKHHPNQLPAEVRRAICQVRSELEAEASQPGHLCYIGARAIAQRLKRQGLHPVPSSASIERTLTAAGLTRRRQPEAPAVSYPHLKPGRVGQLTQVDIVPRYLTGGQQVFCFNALDVVSRYPTGDQSLRRCASDACRFLIQVWQDIGLSDYTQVDNDGCFSGGHTHKGVLGQVVRLALFVGTELVFSPIYNPESNGTVERFHQDYTRTVWANTELINLEDVRRYSVAFFDQYRQSTHHGALAGRSPSQVHGTELPRLPATFCLPEGRLPLTAGQLHFMRLVSPKREISLLNLDWEVPTAEPDQGVWATLTLSPRGATVRVYDAGPDVSTRTCLAQHPFPLKEPVYPRIHDFRRLDVQTRSLWLNWLVKLLKFPLKAAATFSTMC